MAWQPRRSSHRCLVRVKHAGQDPKRTWLSGELCSRDPPTYGSAHRCGRVDDRTISGRTYFGHRTGRCRVDWSRIASEPKLPDPCRTGTPAQRTAHTDRKSTRLNSSHVAIPYAVVCV